MTDPQTSPRPRRPGNRGRTPSGKPNPIDVHVGGRIRLRRTLLGITQEKLGESLGLTFQQVQKYERGTNRVSASRLFDLARVLDVPIGYFFEDMTDTVSASAPSQMPGLADPEGVLSPTPADPALKRETLELVRAYYRIKNPEIRNQVQDLARVLSQTNS